MTTIKVSEELVSLINIFEHNSNFLSVMRTTTNPKLIDEARVVIEDSFRNGSTYKMIKEISAVDIRRILYIIVSWVGRNLQSFEAVSLLKSQLCREKSRQNLALIPRCLERINIRFDTSELSSMLAQPIKNSELRHNLMSVLALSNDISRASAEKALICNLKKTDDQFDIINICEGLYGCASKSSISSLKSLVSHKVGRIRLCAFQVLYRISDLKQKNELLNQIKRDKYIVKRYLELETSGLD